jgi:hypothetical protein
MTASATHSALFFMFLLIRLIVSVVRSRRALARGRRRYSRRSKLSRSAFEPASMLAGTDWRPARYPPEKRGILPEQHSDASARCNSMPVLYEIRCACVTPPVGTGAMHSEFNASGDTPVHLLRIWVMPARAGDQPGYEEKRFDDADKRGRLRVVAIARWPRRVSDDSCGRVDPGRVARRCGSGAVQAGAGPACECAYVQVARGALTVNGEKLDAGDAAMIVDAGKVTLEQVADAEVLLFDLGESNS